jgi:cytoskeleton protein RodZ
VEKFGERLKREREMRGVPLQEIAEATKIGTRSLRALEEERFEQLPGGIFNKGFVRAYARYLGIDEEQAVADYMAAMEEQQQADEPAHLAEIARQVQAQRAQMSSQNNALTWIAVILIGGVIATGAFGWRSWQKDKAAREVTAEQELERKRAASIPKPVAPVEQSVPTNSVAEPAAIGAMTPNSAPPSSALNPSPTAAQTKTPPVAEPAKQVAPAATDASASGAVNLTLKATARTWISVTVDGGKTTTMTLDPSNPAMQSRTFNGADKVFLIVGNPAGLEATLNGKSVGSLGPEGQRRQVTFTPSGMQ